MGEVSFLTPIVEFITKGAEDVSSKADAIEKKLRGVSGQSTTEFKARGQDQVVAVADAVKNKIDATSKAAEIKFKVSGEEKVDKATQAIHQKLAQMAHAGDLSRIIGGSVQDAFMQAGAGIGEMFGGQMSAAFGAAAGAGLAGLGLGAIPGLGELGKFLIGKNEESGRYLAGALTPEDREKYATMAEKERPFWSRTQAGFGSWRKGMESFQDQRVAPEEAEQAMNRLMVLAVGRGSSPEGMAEEYAKMLSTHSPRARASFVRSAGAPVIDALREMFPQYKGEDEEQRLMPAIQSGKIGTMDVVEATRRASHDQIVQQRTEEATGIAPNKGGFWREWGSNIGAIVSSGGRNLTQEDSIHSRGELPGMEGDAAGPWSPHPELSQTHEYAFTSLSGLAEKMQTEANGSGDDVQNQQLTALQQIAENTAKEGGGHPDAKPQPRHAP